MSEDASREAIALIRAIRSFEMYLRPQTLSVRMLSWWSSEGGSEPTGSEAGGKMGGNACTSEVECGDNGSLGISASL